jgi:hypothetical protein
MVGRQLALGNTDPSTHFTSALLLPAMCACVRVCVCVCVCVCMQAVLFGIVICMSSSLLNNSRSLFSGENSQVPKTKEGTPLLRRAIKSIPVTCNIAAGIIGSLYMHYHVVSVHE